MIQCDAGLFEDLFPFARRLCYLRAYGADDGQVVALAIDLEDNPGASVVNAANALRDRIEAVFGCGYRLFCIFPQYKDTWTEVLPPVDDGNATFRTEVSQAKIEQLVGVPVKVPAPSECSALVLGGEGHPLLALIPDEEDKPGGAG